MKLEWGDKKCIQNTDEENSWKTKQQDVGMADIWNMIHIGLEAYDYNNKQLMKNAAFVLCFIKET
jgi:hypothetical protein